MHNQWQPADQVEMQNHQQYIHTYVKKKRNLALVKSKTGEQDLLSLAAFFVLIRIKSKPSQEQMKLGCCEVAPVRHCDTK